MPIKFKQFTRALNLNLILLYFQLFRLGLDLGAYDDDDEINELLILIS